MRISNFSESHLNLWDIRRQVHNEIPIRIFFDKEREPAHDRSVGFTATGSLLKYSSILIVELNPEMMPIHFRGKIGDRADSQTTQAILSAGTFK
jgi:hypothetical protein